MQWERNGNGSRLSDGLDPSSDPAGGSRVETSQSSILLEVGWKEVLRDEKKSAAEDEYR